MPLAVSLPVAGMPLDQTAAFVRDCAGWGYEAVWASEVAGPDFASTLGAVSAGTDLDLGVAVIPVQTRSAWLIAATAASLSHLSGGRFTLGLGTSSELIVEQWSGLPFQRPLAHLRETVEVVRAMLAGERVHHDGGFVTTHGYRLFAPPPAPVPVFVGALGPRSLRQAGEIGDGVCLNQLAPEHMPRVLAELRAGQAAAGRHDGRLPIVARLFCWVTDDLPAARETVRRTFAPYAATSVYNRFFRWLGFDEEMDEVLEAFRKGDRPAASAAMSDRLVDALYVLGDAERVGERVGEYLDAGIDIAAIACIGPGREEAARTLQAVAAVTRG
jgi:probable F420-dependent oxidoreductase